MKIKELCDQIIEKALAHKEITLTRDDLRQLNPTYVNIELGRRLRARNMRSQFKITIGDECLLLSNKNHEVAPSLEGQQQLFSSLVTELHSPELVTAYLLLLSNGIIESIEVAGLLPEELNALYPQTTEGVTTIKTTKGTLIL